MAKREGRDEEGRSRRGGKGWLGRESSSRRGEPGERGKEGRA